LNRAKFRIRVITLTNNVWLPFRHNILSSAVHTACYYKKTPNIQIIEIWDEFEKLWYWTPDTGEKEMSRFATLVREARGSWVTSTLKKLLAEHRIPFTVTAVSDMTWNKEYRVDEWNIAILFTPAQIADYPELQKEMTLTLSSVPKASREDRIKALKEDTETQHVDNVILTYNPAIGRNGWYDLDMLQPSLVAAD